MMMPACTQANATDGKTVQSKTPAPKVNAERPMFLYVQLIRTTSSLLAEYAYQRNCVHIFLNEKKKSQKGKKP